MSLLKETYKTMKLNIHNINPSLHGENTSGALDGVGVPEAKKFIQEKICKTDSEAPGKATCLDSERLL